MDAVGLADIARQIRAYRPAATVFEADIAHAAKGQGLLAAAARKSTAMQAKRAAHDKHIDKAKETGIGIRQRRRRAARRPGGDASDGASDGASDDERDDDERDDASDDEKVPYQSRARTRLGDETQARVSDQPRLRTFAAPFRDDAFFPGRDAGA